jgi:hypothetical protein
VKPSVPAPVHYRLAPGGHRLVLLLAVVPMLVLGAVLLGWLLALEQASRSSLSVWIGTGLAYGCVGLLSWRQARSLPCGWLVWTGHVWRLLPSATPQQRQGPAQDFLEYGSCSLMLDLQQSMLLRLQHVQQGGVAGPVNRSCWVWASQGPDRKHWHALRCAVMGARAAQAGGAQPPVCKGVMP